MDTSHFDGIIIGAGHNGLITAAYLAKAGLKMAVFEARPSVGGGFATEELTAPGFKHIIHAMHCKIHDSPVHNDLELGRYGVSYIFPDPKKVFLRHDSYFIYFQNVEKTYNSIKRISTKDAETFKKVSKIWQQWYLDFVLPEMYSIPKPADQWEAEIRAKPGGKEYLNVIKNYSPLEYATEVFEHEYCQMSFIRGAQSAEYDVNSKGIPCLVFETILNWFIGTTALVRGGIRRIPEALAQIVKEHGGKVFENQKVGKIIVENGAAKGIVLEDGRVVHADRFVASSINPIHTFFFLVGEDKLPKKMQEKVAGFKFKGVSLFRVHLALKERPIFTISQREPLINDGWLFTIGFESPGDFVRFGAQAKAGLIPDVTGCAAGITTVHAPSQAPPGGHVAYAGLPAPFELADGGAARWVDVAKETGDRLMEKFREYAPNITDDKILGRFTYTPKDIEAYLPDMISGDINQGMVCMEQLGYNRPWAGMSRYRTFIDQLYMCGASTHPGGLAVGGPGYNAANAIAEDLGIKKWWLPYDPRTVVTF